MTKAMYMESLKINLKRLPKNDFNRAIDYFEEYFEDAGPEREDQAISDLGDPAEAADQIIKSFAVENAEKPVKDIKSGISSIWIGLLAVMASPIALPLLLSFGIVAVALIFSIFVALGALMIAGGALVIASPLTLIAGFTVIFYSFPAFLNCLGFSLISAGCGLLLCYGMFRAICSFMNFNLRYMSKIVKKGGVKNEKI